MQRHLRPAQGFTLVEFVMVIVLVGVMATLGSSMISDAFTSSRFVSAQDKSGDEARYALERIARELREVKYDSATTSYGITSALSAGATSIAFTRTISGADVTVTLTKTGTTLTLAYSSPAVTSALANGVSTFTLDFLKSDGTTAATLTTDVRLIVVNLAMTDPTSGQSVAERARIMLRNG